MAADQLDRDEQLLWRILYRLEALALDRYERFAPPLAIAAKREITRVLARGAPDEACLMESVVNEPFRELLDAASSGKAPPVAELVDWDVAEVKFCPSRRGILAPPVACRSAPRVGVFPATRPS